jgi:DNA-binding transcriptional LysR family regulator
MEGFVRAVELGGFSAAARELKLTPSAMSKLVTRLERSLGVRLLNRTTRKLVPTPEGELFLSRCRRILAEMEDAQNEVGRSREMPRGRLKLHVGVGFGTHVFVPELPRFLERYPEVEIELTVLDEVVDLVQHDVDIAIRPAPAVNPALVARKICEFRRIVCAAPAYLSRFGGPRTPRGLETHRCITIGDSAAMTRWAFESPAGREVIDIKGSVKVNNANCMLQLARDGVGLVRLNEFSAAPCVRDGTLVPVLREFECPETLEMMALYPHERHRLPRVRAMLDFLVESFAHSPWCGVCDSLQSDHAYPGGAAKPPTTSAIRRAISMGVASSR